MAFVQRMLLVASVAALGAMAAPQRGNNEYLPPAKGYDYPKPSVPFPPAPPTYRPPQNTPPAYQPPQNTPPAYKPPQNTPPAYQPPQPIAPTYGPPAYKPPTYQPPQPIAPTYGPPVTRPPYNPQPPIRDDIPGSSNIHNNNQNHDHGHGHGEGHVHEPGMPYDFNYAVKDDYYGTDFSQNEASDGDNVKGEYRVQLPDGRLQIVTYTADWKTGFHAVVTYEGEAKYPEQKPYVPQASNNNVNNIADPGYNYQPPSKPIKPANNYGAPNY